MKKIPAGSRVPVRLTLAERDLIREHTLYDPSFATIAEVKVKHVVVNMTLDALEDLLGYIAAEANHTDDRKLESKLDRVYDRLQKILEEHDDQAGT